MYKNVSGQKVAVYAWDGANSTAKISNAASITAYISKDGGNSSALSDTNPTELNATNHPGIYIFDLTATETSADLVVISPVSETADINIRPIIVTPTLFTLTKSNYINYSISTIATDVDDILVDTNELQTNQNNWLTATLTNVENIVDSLDIRTASILSDTNELQTDLTDGGRLDLLIDSIKTKTDNLPSGIQKNSAFTNFQFLMYQTDHVTPATNLTVTAEISKDGGAFSSCASSVSEISSGLYKINLTATEMNADIISLKFTGTSADQRTITMVTDE